MVNVLIRLDEDLHRAVRILGMELASPKPRTLAQMLSWAALFALANREDFIAFIGNDP
jgi:hypothetical protein